MTHAQKVIRTHHEAFDVLHPPLLDALAQQQHTYARPHEEEHAERDGDQPVERREVHGAAEDDVQRWRVDDEHAEARARDDAGEVVVVADDRASEREAELRFDGEHLYYNERGVQFRVYVVVTSAVDRTYVEALDDEDGEVN